MLSDVTKESAGSQSGSPALGKKIVLKNGPQFSKRYNYEQCSRGDFPTSARRRMSCQSVIETLKPRTSFSEDASNTRASRGISSHRVSVAPGLPFAPAGQKTAYQWARLERPNAPPHQILGKIAILLSPKRTPVWWNQTSGNGPRFHSKPRLRARLESLRVRADPQQERFPSEAQPQMCIWINIQMRICKRLTDSRNPSPLDRSPRRW